MTDHINFVPSVQCNIKQLLNYDINLHGHGSWPKCVKLKLETIRYSAENFVKIKIKKRERHVSIHKYIDSLMYIENNEI